jgi:hypothetical protein
MSTSTRTAGRRHAVKVAGSLAVVGAAVAVAGLGTFGGFTDSTSVVDAGVGTGVLSIDVSAAGSSAPVPVTTARMLPGDVTSVPMDLRNSGDVDLSSLVLLSRATTSSLLDSDPVHGLQLRVDSCATAWVRSGAGYSCAGGAGALYAGPVAVDTALPAARSLQAGRTDHLLATVSFPTTGGDAMENQSSSLEFVFTGTQRAGGAR